jgi:rhodanese-related sulfurtransferase
MRGLLLKTAVLLGVALAAGFAHSRVGPRLMLHVPVQTVRAGESGARLPTPGPTGPTRPIGPTAPSGPTTAPTGEKTPTPPVVEPAPPKPVSELFITLQRAKELLDHGDAVFVDARNYDEYKAEHILGAVSLPKQRFDGAAGGEIARKYLIGQRVVLYCHGADCTDSEAVAKRLIALNMNIGPIHIIKDGFPGWKAAGYPVEQGG